MTTQTRHDLSDPAMPEGMVRITQGSSYRFIWPVHLGGWQAVGWQLPAAGEQLMPEPRLPEPEPLLEPEPEPEAQPLPEATEVDVQELPAGEESAPSPELEPATEPQPGQDAETAEALPVTEATDFQAMTKAQIIEHCLSVYGVDLDSSQTKAELVEQATALEHQTAPANDEPLVDGLLDLDDPLI